MNGLRRVGELALLVAFTLGLGGVRAEAAPLAQGDHRIAYGETAEGVITDATSEQTWRFVGAEGDIVLIDMVAAEVTQLDPLLALQDGDGNVLTSDDDGGVGLNARIGPYILPATGEYVIVASQYSGTGRYTLRLDTLNTAPRLRPGKPLQGHLDQTTPIEYYQIQAEGDEPELVRLAVTSPVGGDGYPLQVYSPSGHSIQGDPEAPSVIAPLLLLPHQRYIVAVGQSEDVVGGPYTLTLTPADASLLRDGAPQQGQLFPDATPRRHYFIGQAGDTIRVTLEGEGSALQNLSLTLTLPNDGAYMVGLFAEHFTTDQVGYTLTVTWAER